MSDTDKFIQDEARLIVEHFRAKETAAYLRGFVEGQNQQRQLHSQHTSLGLRYTTTGRFAGTPREAPETDAPLYTTPKEVWRKEWLQTWLQMAESVGSVITSEEYYRAGNMIVEMARDDVAGTVAFKYGDCTYLYEVVEVELYILPTEHPNAR